MDSIECQRCVILKQENEALKKQILISIEEKKRMKEQVDIVNEKIDGFEQVVLQKQPRRNSTPSLYRNIIQYPSNLTLPPIRPNTKSSSKNGNFW